MKLLNLMPGIESYATFSMCGSYRFDLHRNMRGMEGKRLMVIGLNPSTADVNFDDPTIAKLQRMAFGRLGFHRFVMTNLFGWRATKPADMLKAIEPVGYPSNDELLRLWARSSDMIIAAWGTTVKANHPRVLEVVNMLASITPLYAFKLTDGGQPYHPLYLPETTTPFLWRDKTHA